MKQVSKNKQLIINMIASLTSCIITLGITFMLQPIIIADEGFAGSGFISLAEQFTTYAAILAMALNSMAGRFITIKLHQNNKEEANQYFNSVLYANLGIVASLLIPFFLLIAFLERIINIPEALVGDVKILFVAAFLNFMVTIISTTFSTATFATNRLDLTALRTIESQIIKAVLLVAAFSILPVKIYYMGIATLVATLYMFFAYLHYTKKLLPEISISPRFFRMKKVLEILAAGVWNTIMRAGQTLTNGLDALIANLWIGTEQMGYVAISKSIATSINLLYETISAVFTPSLTISYAKDNKKELVEDLSSAMKLTGFFANIPLAFVCGFGIPFYTLWLQRAKDITNPEIIQTVYILTLLTMLGTIVGGAISPLFNVYTIVNKLKWNALVTLIMGAMSLGVVLIYISLNEPAVVAVRGVYVIVGTSTLLGIFKNLTFTPMYAAHCLGISKKSFYPVIVRYTIVSVIMIGIFSVFNYYIPTTSWFVLVLDILLCGVVGSLLNFFFLFGKKEKTLLLDTILKFLKRKEA